MINKNELIPTTSIFQNRTRWPWSIEVDSLVTDYNKTDWPKISIVTPSYNQGAYIEETIRSILLQGYPNLEYIVIDGGSTDATLDIIKKYEKWITHWISEPDHGMYDAINKGFKNTTGDILAWSNTDDVYLPGSFHAIGSVFRQFKKVDWVTSLWKVQWDRNSNELRRYKINGFDRRAFKMGRNLLGKNRYATHMIQQQSTFWTRRLWQRSGSRVDDKLLLAGDFELWSRFYGHADLYAIDRPLGIFRFQPDQKTAKYSDDYLMEAEKAFKQYGGRYPSKFEGFFRSRLLSRIPTRALSLFGPLIYNAFIISIQNNGTWTKTHRCFI